MKNRSTYLTLFLLFVLTACSTNEPTVEGALDTSGDKQGEIVLPVDATAVDDALADLEDKTGKIDEIPAPIEPPPAPAPPPTSAEKKPVWKVESPFYGKGACTDWDGEAGTMTADCCKYVLANYGALLDAPETDVMKLMTQDPFVAACKKFNDDFLDKFDLVENPE